MATWRLSDADRALRRAKAKRESVDYATLSGRLSWMRSDFDAVVKQLTPIVAKHADAYEARVLLGRALYARGDNHEGYAVLDRMAEDYNADRITTAEDLMWLGVGLRLTDYVKNANEVFRDALKKDDKLDQARVLWADLFVSKWNFQDSDALYREVLARDKSHPGATLGVARIDVLSDRKFAEARKKLEAILKMAPEHVPAHNLLALIELENERPAAAAQRLEAHSLKIAPRDADALSLLGAALYLMDDAKRFRQVEARALAGNPRFAAFYTTVAEHATRMHRYREALTLNEKALALDRESWRAMAGLGVGYSRVGDDDKAVRYLNESFDGDPYDVRTFNLLNHFYDDVKDNYGWVDVDKMRLRVHAKERPILERYVPPLLKEAYGALTKKYDFTPAPPLHVEVFPDEQTFAVRSIGLPQLSAHGICFGHVVTSRSPSAGNFNWAEVLWHELSHVFHIQISKSRVPRWFTEGLAVFESTEGRPHWVREMDEDLLAYRKKDLLRGVVDFNLSFTRAKSLKDILVAYYQAYKVAAFIDGNWGFPKMKRMLALWGEHKRTPDVVKTALGVDAATFDARFFEWLDKDLAYLDVGFSLDLEPFSDDPDVAIGRARDKPEDVSAVQDGAAAAVAKGDKAVADRLSANALKLDEKAWTARFIQARIAIDAKRWDDAQTHLDALIAGGMDSASVRMQLARVADGRGDGAAAAQHLERAIAFNPKDASLYNGLIAKLKELGDTKAVFAWQQRLTGVDQMDPSLPLALLEGAEAHGASKADVLLWGEMGNHIAPFSADLHARFAKELARLGVTDQARFEADSALIIAPGHPMATAVLGGL